MNYFPIFGMEVHAKNTGFVCRLEYMHGKGIAYRDLKPENTLIAENGYPKLIDMGFAKRLYNRRTYSMCGTPDYMAPEIIKRQGHGKGVDYWALGCMIFEMITCTSPFNSGNDPPQVRKIETQNQLSEPKCNQHRKTSLSHVELLVKLESKSVFFGLVDGVPKGCRGQDQIPSLHECQCR